MPESKRSTLMLALPVTAAVLMMGVSCYYQGMWSERWGEFPELQIFAEQLPSVPMDVGEWHATDAGKSDERVRKESGAAGELNRVYRNPAGEEVRVMIMCARFRDVFYHTPDRCYPAAGFEMLTEPQLDVIDLSNGEVAQFFTTTFRKSEPTGTHEERGFWSWSANGSWLAPSNEKITFAGTRALYKVYVFGNVPPGNRRSDHDFCTDFIRVFMPAVTTALRPGFEKAERGRGNVVEAKSAPPTAPASKPATEPAA
jgi:hypothetical protein